MFHRRPTGLHIIPHEAGTSLARLSAIEGLARSILVGVVPLMALEALGSKQAVTNAYLAGSILTLLITLNFTSLEKWLQRRWVVTLGGIFLIFAAFLLYVSKGIGFSLGIGLRSAAASLFSVCLSLYIMDYIGKRELTWVESKRLVYTGAGWLIGPTLGIWLWNNMADWTPFALASVCGFAMLGYFWRLRLGPNVVVTRAKNKSVNPLKIIPRYFSQSKLRIAYLITLSRSIFWVSLFVYGPIYVVEAGMPQWMAGGLLSFVSGLLFFSPMVRQLAEHIGTRNTILIGQFICAGSVFILFLLPEPNVYGIGLWILASIGGAMLDVMGNIPFMRMVKPRERTEMTMIFSTWREGSELLTPLLAALILLFLPFKWFYLLLAVLLLCAAIASSYLPKRL